MRTLVVAITQALLLSTLCTAKADVDPVHLSPSAPEWKSASVAEEEGPQRRTVYQNPQVINPNAFNRGFQQGSQTPLLDATRDAAQDVGRWGSTTAQDLGQGTRKAAEGVVNGLRDSLQATGNALTNAVENTINVGNDNYYRSRQTQLQPGSANTTAAQFQTQFQQNTVAPPAPTNQAPIANSFATSEPQASQNFSQPGSLATQFTTQDTNQPSAQQFGSGNRSDGFRPSTVQPVERNVQNERTVQNPPQGPRFELPQRFSDTSTANNNSNQNGFFTPTNQNTGVLSRPSQVQPVQQQNMPNNAQSNWDNLAGSNFGGFSAPPQNQNITSAGFGQGTSPQPQYQSPGGNTAWGTAKAQVPPAQNQAPQQGNSAQLVNYDPNRVDFASRQEPQQQNTDQQVTTSSTPIMLGVGLIGSLALNLFVGTSYLDVRNKYRSALRRSPRDLR